MKNNRKMEHLFLCSFPDGTMKYIIFYLQEQNEDSWEKLQEQLNLQGARIRAVSRKEAEKCETSETAVVTDSQELAVHFANWGYVCVGIAGEKNGYFAGAELVYEDLEAITRPDLEMHLLRMTGRPVSIASTGRLMLREITESDLDRIEQIGHEAATDGNYVFEEGQSDIFSKIRMWEYIQYVYRYFGYGLWAVCLKNGPVIGICGVNDIREGEFPDVEHVLDTIRTDREDGPVVLEIQYLLDTAYKGQGYGEEMSRAAIHYAFAELEVDELWLRTYQENIPSVTLAEKLGFRRERQYAGHILWYRLSKAGSSPVSAT
jgi:RimJ/RimL family protein N-acetyltransferase